MLLGGGKEQKFFKEKKILILRKNYSNFCQLPKHVKKMGHDPAGLLQVRTAQAAVQRGQESRAESPAPVVSPPRGVAGPTSPPRPRRHLHLLCALPKSPKLSSETDTRLLPSGVSNHPHPSYFAPCTGVRANITSANVFTILCTANSYLKCYITSN